ncbi:MAG: amidohydrolase family protein [Planctomycetaceae bacterium]
MIVDVNVHLSRWPFRRLPLDETPALLAKLRASGITSAWAGSFDALLHRDVAGVNARLTEECRQHGDGLLIPFGTVNPILPDWREDVRRCAEEHHMPGIRLYPGFHEYRMQDDVTRELLALASDSGLIVQLVVGLEDLRTQHPLMQIPAVDLAPLESLLPQLPQLKLVLLDAQRSARLDLLARLVAAGEVYVDIATQEGVGGLGKLLSQLPTERVLFGSHAPFYYVESAVLKLRETDLGHNQQTAIESGNALRLLSPAPPPS